VTVRKVAVLELRVTSNLWGHSHGKAAMVENEYYSIKGQPVLAGIFPLEKTI